MVTTIYDVSSVLVKKLSTFNNAILSDYFFRSIRPHFLLVVVRILFRTSTTVLRDQELVYYTKCCTIYMCIHYFNF